MEKPKGAQAKKQALGKREVVLWRWGSSSRYTLDDLAGRDRVIYLDADRDRQGGPYAESTDIFYAAPTHYKLVESLPNSMPYSQWIEEQSLTDAERTYLEVQLLGGSMLVEYLVKAGIEHPKLTEWVKRWKAERSSPENDTLVDKYRQGDAYKKLKQEVSDLHKYMIDTYPMLDAVYPTHIGRHKETIQSYIKGE
jgi:hypothetical protein